MNIRCEMYVWFQEWVDEYLSWDPAEHGGAMSFSVDPKDIWIPDIVLFNA